MNQTQSSNSNDNVDKSQSLPLDDEEIDIIMKDVKNTDIKNNNEKNHNKKLINKEK